MDSHSNKKYRKILATNTFIFSPAIYSSCVLTAMIIILLTIVVFVKIELEIGLFSID